MSECGLCGMPFLPGDEIHLVDIDDEDAWLCARCWIAFAVLMLVPEELDKPEPVRRRPGRPRKDDHSVPTWTCVCGSVNKSVRCRGCWRKVGDEGAVKGEARPLEGVDGPGGHSPS